jgi:hypothetical protein
MTRSSPEVTEPAGRWGWAPARWAWPGYLCGAALLLYAAEKAYYAAHSRLGIPGGPHVPASAYDSLHHVALRQWTLTLVGLGAGLLALASVTPPGRYLPRWMMLAALWGALVPMAAGLPYVVHAALTEAGSTPAMVVGLVRPFAQLAIWTAMAWSYQRRSRVLRRRRADR